tara:strand:+ start:50 stop:229 length:180 start_codon:yes stop_codon:yes gene_type:complete
MSGGGSFSSDQTTINMTTVGANTLARTGRTRITSIQGEGIAGSTINFSILQMQQHQEEQ